MQFAEDRQLVGILCADGFAMLRFGFHEREVHHVLFGFMTLTPNSNSNGVPDEV